MSRPTNANSEEIDPKHQVLSRAVFVVAAITLVLDLLLVNQLELLASMVNFGALIGFLLLHLSVIAHFIIRRKSRRWFAIYWCP